MRQVTPHHTLIELVQSFRQLRVLVIGDAMLDTYLEGEATRLCSEGPVPVVRKTVEQRIPGGAANTAANVCALGADVALLGVAGRDMAGSLLREAVRACGIADRWLVEDATVPTLHKLRVLANGHYVVRFDEGGPRSEQRSPYTAACQQDMLARLVELYRRCDVVVVSDYCYGVVSDALIAQLRVLHEEQPKIILIDSKALQRFHDFPATIITPNYREALQVVSMLEGGLQGNEEAAYPAQIEYLARTLLRRMRTEHVAITLGEHGVFLLDRHEHALHLPAHPVYRAHDVGAGDSFATALALALAAGGRVEEAARIALDAAGIAVTRSRTSVVRYHELLQRVSLRAYTTGAHASVAQRGAGSQEALTALLARIAEARQAGRSLVFTNGVFDILHAGHIQFLRQAKALGDMLIVGVNSDSSAHRLKGRGRPINCEQDRVALVAALDVVDEVVLFEEDTPTELIRVLQPDIHVKGGDYADEVLPEAQAVREYGGRVVILPLAGSMSTSSVIERIVAIAAEQSAAVTHEADDRVYDYDHSQGRKA